MSNKNFCNPYYATACVKFIEARRATRNDMVYLDTVIADNRRATSVLRES